MKRKLIKQNKTSYVITLPKKWIVKNNLVGGEVLDLFEKDNNLIIKNLISSRKSICIDFKKIKENKERSTNIILNSIYRNGYDEIIIKLFNEDKFIFEQLLSNNQVNDYELYEIGDGYLKLINFIEYNNLTISKLFEKILFLILDLINNIDTPYDNFNNINKIENYIKIIRRNIPNLFIEKNNSNLNNITDNILFNLIIIVRNLKNIISNNFTVSFDIKNKLSNLFKKTFYDLRFDKISIGEIQNLYSNLEKEILTNSLTILDLYLWELIRNISYASINLNSNNLFLKV